MICPNCKNEIAPGSKFCQSCGAPVENIAADSTPAPSQDVTPEAIPNTEVNPQPETAEAPSSPVQTAVKEPDVIPSAAETRNEFLNNQSKKKKYTAVGIAVVAVIVVAVVLIISALSKGGSDQAPVLFIKDNDLYAYEKVKEKAEPVLVANDVTSNNYILSEDNKYVLYLSGDYDDDDYDLYYKEIFKEKDEPTLIEKNVDHLVYISENFESVYYNKDDNIYHADLKGNNTKILSDISDVGYYGYDNKNDEETQYIGAFVESGDSDDYYIIDLSNNSAIEIAKDVENVFPDADDRVIYYIDEDNTLYKSDAKGNSTEIAKDVEDAFMSQGNLYYLSDAKEVSMYDFFSDSNASADQSVTYPSYSDYQSKYDFLDPKYDADQEKLDQQYEEAYDKYNEAQDRIYLRESLKESTIEVYSLNYYDGSKATKVLDNVSSNYGQVYNMNTEDTDTLYYVKTCSMLESGDKFCDITEIESLDNSDFLYDQYSFVSEVFDVYQVCTGSSFYVINSGDDIKISSILYDSSSKKYYITTSEEEESDSDSDYSEDDYYYDDYSSDSYTTYYNNLYVHKSGATSLSDMELVCEHLALNPFILEGSLCYYQDNDDTYDLNYDGKTFEDAYPFIFKLPDSNDIYFLSDYSDKNNTVSISKIKGKESEVIATDVYPYSFNYYDGKWIVLSDVDYDDYDGMTGDLVCIDGKDKFTLETGVSGVNSDNIVVLKNSSY